MFSGKFSHTLCTFCSCTKTVTTLSYHRSSFCHTILGAWHCLWSWHCHMWLKWHLVSHRPEFTSEPWKWFSELPCAVGNKYFYVRSNQVWSHYIKENGTSLNWALEDKICTANYNTPEFVLTACQVGTLISRQWPAVLSWFDASLHPPQSQNPHSYWPHSGSGTGRTTKTSGLNMVNRWVHILCFESLLQEYVQPLCTISPFPNRIN